MPRALHGFFSLFIACVAPASAQFVYLANAGSASVTLYNLDRHSGRLAAAAGSPYPAGVTPVSLAVDPESRLLFAAGMDGLSVMKIQRQSGVPRLLHRSPLNLRIRQVAVHPSGRFLYAMGWLTTGIYAFTINGKSGNLAEVPGSPFTAPGINIAIAPHPSGRFLYGTNVSATEDMGTITTFAVDLSTGALRASSSVNEVRPDNLTMHPSGKFVLLAHNIPGSPASIVSVWAVNPSSGALTRAGGGTLGSPFDAVSSLTVHPGGRYVYFRMSNTVEAMAFDATTGNLTALPGSPFALGPPGFGAAAVTLVDASGKYLYTGGQPVPANQIAGFSVSPFDGALTKLPSSPYYVAGTPVVMISSP